MPAFRVLAIAIAIVAWSALSVASALSCGAGSDRCKVAHPESFETPSFRATAKYIDAIALRSALGRQLAAGSTGRSDIDWRTMAPGVGLDRELTDVSAVEPSQVRAEHTMSAGLLYPRAHELNDQALLSRLLMMFGTALAAASAMRIFVR